MDSTGLTETKCILKSIVISTPFKMTIDVLNKDYAKTMGYQIPFRKFGYRTLEQFLYSIPDTLLLSCGRNPFIYVPSSEKTQHMENLSSIKKNVSNVKNNNIKRVPFNKYVPANQNYHVPPTNFRPTPNISRNMTANRNELQMAVKKNVAIEMKSGRTCNTEVPPSTSQNIATSSNILQMEVKHVGAEMEPDRKCNIELNNHEKIDFITAMNEAVPDFNKNDAIFLLDFPTNCVKFGHKIESIKLPKDLKNGDIFALFVTEIHNPYKFWFHIAKSNDELDEMMKRLEYFFENPDQELVMQFSNIIPGQICAAPYAGLWHRAEILEIPNDNKVKVCFFDYGTVCKVPTTSIHYLPMEFSKLNKQALRGCLSHIRPSGLRWSRDATYSFLDMVADKLIYGKVVEILRDDKIIRLVLTDTNQPEEFQINSALVSKNHAKLNKQNPFKLFCKLYYPTFEMLENGEYPTFHDLGILLAQGIDYEQNVYNNIICDVFAKKCSLNEYIEKLTSYHLKRIK